ncbi:MAG: exonuclease SbcCD subunit D [Planctomycetales bacterium]
MVRFLHAADIHLDSQLKGLEQYEGAPVEAIRGATRRAMERLVELAIEERVDFVLIAGDLYDGDWKDHNTGLFFVKQAGRLRAADIPLYIIAGNHDAAAKMTRSLPFPANPAGDSPLFSSAKAETRSLPELGVAIHGRSFATQAETSNLAREYPQAIPGMFNIGLLHTSLDGHADHAPYAPCTLDDLRGKGYDYWALGHVHTRNVVAQAPWVVYPGNPQGRHIREPGEKGCYLVTASSAHEVQLEFRSLDVFRWEQIPIDCTGMVTLTELQSVCSLAIQETAARHAPAAVGIRLVLSGATSLHQTLAAGSRDWLNDIRSLALGSAVEGVWIEKVKVQTEPPPHADSAAEVAETIGELTAYLAELADDGEQLHALAVALEPLRNKLPAELRTGPEALLLDDPAWIRQALSDVQPLLLERLARPERRD